MSSDTKGGYELTIVEMVIIKPKSCQLWLQLRQWYQVGCFEKSKSEALLLPSDIRERGLECGNIERTGEEVLI